MAEESAIGVNASSIEANSFILTLVSVFAAVSLQITSLALGTLASERSDGIDALPALAKSRNRLALVDVYRSNKTRTLTDSEIKRSGKILINSFPIVVTHPRIFPG